MTLILIVSSISFSYNQEWLLPQIDNLLSGQKIADNGGGGNTFIFNTNAIDAQGVAEFVASDSFKENLIDRINFNDLKLTTVSGEALEGAF